MANYHYQGIVAYTAEDKFDGMALSTLGRYIHFPGVRDLDLEDPHDAYAHEVFHEAGRLESIETASSAQLLEQHLDVTHPDVHMLPMHTPQQYTQAFVERYNAKGASFLKLYIPLAARDENVLNDVADAVIPILKELFGDELVNIRRMTGTEQDDFDVLYRKNNDVIYRAY